ncbi:MAG TPA: NAD(+) diphosphatase [Solirubrobacteraceae bacterium]|nr:NAD(+) diphosphatase [Solirubrobacteraceae bacterium]
MADRTTQAPPTVAFAGGALDRSAHLRDDAERLRTSHSSQVIVVGPDQQIGLEGDGTLARVPATAVPRDMPLTFLGVEPSGAAVFAGDAASEPGHGFAALRELMSELDPADAALAAYAVGMVGWHRVNRYCGRSGHATEVEAGGHRRRCPGCGLVQFPRTDPAVTMLVQSNDKALLSRRKGAPKHRWSALAGFVEPGETPEEAVVREAREETGVEITAVKYVTSQPWPFPAALMIGFWAFADPAGADGAPQPQPSELVEARWWPRAELAEAIQDDRIALPPPGTIGNYLIATWLAKDS